LEWALLQLNILDGICCFSGYCRFLQSHTWDIRSQATANASFSLKRVLTAIDVIFC
jgi:hypothetical protein